MPPLSPYTATFAGRAVAAGRLSLDLQYRIVDRALVGQNKAVMENFKLGERVEAPNALDLPLDLAIALLTDSEGRITVAVPIQGNVGQPTFDYRHLIREAIGNLIPRVVSPLFRALGRLFGGVDEVASIEFTPGSARLRPPEREKLDKVAHVLSERRELKLVIRGPFDPERDGEAVRSNGVRRDVAQALGVKLEGREDPGPIAYSDAATSERSRRSWRHGGPKAMEELARVHDAHRPRSRARQSVAGTARAREPRPRVLPGGVPPTGRAVSAAAERAAGARGAPGGGDRRVPRRFGGHRAEPPGVRRVRPVHAAVDEPVTLQLALDVVKPFRWGGGLARRAGRHVAARAPAIEERAERGSALQLTCRTR